jgi:hypothetical protein
MKNQKIQEMSTETLLKQKKIIEAVTGMFSGVLTVLFIVTLVSSFKQGFTPLLILPFALLPILVLNVNNWQAIKKELNSRV